MVFMCMYMPFISFPPGFLTKGVRIVGDSFVYERAIEFSRATALSVVSNIDQPGSVADEIDGNS